MLCTEVSYPIGTIEDKSQGYFVKDSNALAPNHSGFIQISVQAFSHPSRILPNRNAITVTIPCRIEESDPEICERTNDDAMKRLQTQMQYATLDSVSETMIVSIDEVKKIILEYLLKLEDK
jgi:hypothetical protein